MFGITLNGLHTHKDMGMKCLDYTLTEPQPNTYCISIDGADGEEDLTELAFGRTTYKGRELTASFDRQDTLAGHAAFRRELTRKYHGKTVKAILDSDSGYYLQGRLTWATPKHENIFGLCEFKMKCDPYMYKRDITSLTFTVSNGLVITLPNSEMPVCPTFHTVSTGIEIQVGSKRVSIPPGGVQIGAITLEAGNNIFTLYGSGSLRIEYREGVM